MNSSFFKKIIFWLIFLIVAGGTAFYLVYFLNESKTTTDNFIFEKTIGDVKQEATPITVKVPETEDFYIELNKTKIGDGSNKYYSEFKDTRDGVTNSGSIILLEDLAYNLDDYSIKPLVVNFGGSGNFFYLALFDKDMNHLDSLFIGDRIQYESFGKYQNEIKFKYKSHHITQSFSEEPMVDTFVRFYVENDKFVETYKYFNATEDDIVVIAPKPNEIVYPKFTIEFDAKGWLFENTSSAKAITSIGEVLDQKIASSDENWMVSEKVRISAQLDADDYKDRVRIVLEADNASGIPKHDKKIEYWVWIK